jgi:hypothetical protein
MRHVNTALCYHLYQITVAELLSDVPTSAQNDYRVIEVTRVK